MTASSTKGRWLVGISIAFAVAVVAWGAYVLTDLLATRTYRTSRAFPLTHSIVLRGGDGNVTVVPDARGRVVVQQTVRRGLAHTSGVVSVDAHGVLQLGTRCPGFLIGTCSIHTTVHVPVDVDISGSLGDGNLTARGLHGTVQVHTGDGSIHLVRQVGDISLSSGDGQVRLDGVRAKQLRVSTGDGSVSMRLVTAPDSVVLHTGDGSVDVKVPDDGTAYAITTDTGDGSVHDDLANDPRASSHIAVSTGDGSVRLGYG